MTLRIGLDLDGVVYDFVDDFRQYLVEGMYLSGDYPDPTSWNIWDHWPITEEMFAGHLKDAIKFGDLFAHADCTYPGAVAAVRRLADAGHTIHIVTHRPTAAVAATVQWLADVDLPYTTLTFAADKTTVPVNVIIEDNVDNALAVVSTGARAILMDRPWNREWEGAEVHDTGSLIRVTGWDDVETLVANLDLPPRRIDVTTSDDVHRVYLDTHDLASALPGEVRVTSDTGGQKGAKPARFDMIPPDVLTELAHHYGRGEAKYPSDPATGEANWQKGYAWSLSAAALMRHWFAWLDGEDLDPETGSSHLCAVMWHAIALRWWQLHDRGTDDLQGRQAEVSI